jgi:conjugal transfer ATP-binding protein TraC
MFENLMNASRTFSRKVAHYFGDETPRGMSDTPVHERIDLLFNHHVLSSLLPYETFDPETSLFVNKKSIGFVLETTPLLGSSEEIENILTSVITDSLPATVDIQFLLWASPKIGPTLDAFEVARSKNEIFTWLAKKRTDYLKKGAYSSLSQHGSLLLRDFRTFIVVSTQKKQADNTGELIGLRDDIESALQSIHIGSRVMNAQSFLSMMFDLITPTSDLYPHDFAWSELDSLASQLTHPEWKLQVKRDALLFSSRDEAMEAHCLTVREYPQKATQWKTTENLGQLFNATLQIPCPFLISFSVRKVNHEKALTDSQLKTMNKESTAKSPLAKFKPSVNQEYADWQHIRKRLGEGDALVKTFYQVILFAKPQDAKLCERRLRDLYRANGWKLRKESYMQLQSWLAALPMMMTEGLFEDMKQFGRLKTMTAFNAINVAPLQGEWKGTKSPSLLLPGRRGQLATWNPFDNEGGNFNIAVTAAPGKGKSALIQEYVMATLGASGHIQVIDQGHSQQKLCRELGGQFIEFSPSSPLCLNPFTSIVNLDESIVMLKPLLSNMARPLRGATEEELSYLEQALKAAYEREGNKATITTIAVWLNEQTDMLCKNLSHLLYSFTKKGVYAPFFEGACSVDFNNPFVVMELQDLKSKKELRNIVLQLLIYQISQKMYQSDRNQIKSCIIDEAWDLFDDENMASAKFIEAGYRTARKFRGNFISIAHSVSDFHRNPMTKAAFDCSDFKIILGQTDEAINKLKHDKIMDIDGFTERLLKSLKITKDYSECVIKGPEGLSVHRILFDPYSRILYSTKGEEFDAVNQLLKNGSSLREAIEIVARHFHHV